VNESFSFAGLRIFIQHPTPKIVVGHFWWLSDELREAMQTRMIIRFGYMKSSIEPGHALRMGRNVFMHPADAHQLRKSCEKKN